jgi:hypothetical protein
MFCRERSGAGADHTVGATEAGAMWQRTSASRHIMQEDVIRSPKYAHCPLPHIVPKPQADVSYTVGHSHHWNNSWAPLDVRFSPDAKLDSHWQSSPSTSVDCCYKLGGLDEGLNSRFSKPTGLQALAAESSLSLKSNAGPVSTVSDYNAAPDYELDWQFIVDPKCKAGLDTPILEERIDKEGEQVLFVEVSSSDMKKDGTKVFDTSEVGPSEVYTMNREMGKPSVEIMTKISNKIIAPAECLLGGRDEATMTSSEGVVYEDTTEPKGIGHLSSMDKTLRRQNRGEEMVILLAELKAADSLGDGAYPTSSAQSLPKTPLSSCDVIGKEIDNNRSVDENLLTAILHRKEPSRLENTCLPSFAMLPDTSTATEGRVLFHTVSQPLTIPCIVTRPPMRRGSSSVR